MEPIYLNQSWFFFFGLLHWRHKSVFTKSDAQTLVLLFIMAHFKFCVKERTPKSVVWSPNVCMSASGRNLQSTSTVSHGAWTPIIAASGDMYNCHKMLNTNFLILSPEPCLAFCAELLKRLWLKKEWRKLWHVLLRVNRNPSAADAWRIYCLNYLYSFLISFSFIIWATQRGRVSDWKAAGVTCWVRGVNEAPVNDWI